VQTGWRGLQNLFVQRFKRALQSTYDCHDNRQNDEPPSQVPVRDQRMAAESCSPQSSMAQTTALARQLTYPQRTPRNQAEYSDGIRYRAKSDRSRSRTRLRGSATPLSAFPVTASAMNDQDTDLCRLRRFHVIVAWLNSVLLTRHLAYGLKLTFWHGAAIFLIIHVGAAIPSAPCNPGTWQFLIVVGLTLFGIDKTRAIRFLSCRVSDPCHPPPGSSAAGFRTPRTEPPQDPNRDRIVGERLDQLSRALTRRGFEYEKSFILEYAGYTNPAGATDDTPRAQQR